VAKKTATEKKRRKKPRRKRAAAKQPFYGVSESTRETLSAGVVSYMKVKVKVGGVEFYIGTCKSMTEGLALADAGCLLIGEWTKSNFSRAFCDMAKMYGGNAETYVKALRGACERILESKCGLFGPPSRRKRASRNLKCREMWIEALRKKWSKTAGKLTPAQRWTATAQAVESHLGPVFKIVKKAVNAVPTGAAASPRSPPTAQDADPGSFDNSKMRHFIASLASRSCDFAETYRHHGGDLKMAPMTPLPSPLVEHWAQPSLANPCTGCEDPVLNHVQKVEGCVIKGNDGESSSSEDVMRFECQRQAKRARRNKGEGSMHGPTASAMASLCCPFSYHGDGKARKILENAARRNRIFLLGRKADYEGLEYPFCTTSETAIVELSQALECVLAPTLLPGYIAQARGRASENDECIDSAPGEDEIMMASLVVQMQHVINCVYRLVSPGQYVVEDGVMGHCALRHLKAMLHLWREHKPYLARRRCEIHNLDLALRAAEGLERHEQNDCVHAESSTDEENPTKECGHGEHGQYRNFEEKRKNEPGHCRHCDEDKESASAVAL
jgi:hypothetical protein